MTVFDLQRVACVQGKGEEGGGHVFETYVASCMYCINRLSVPAPHPKIVPAPKSLTSAHEVMNQLHTPNPHSVIASDVEICRSTPQSPPQLCLNPCLLNQDRVSEPQTEWISSLSLAGAPELCKSDNASMRDTHCEVMLSERISHTRVESISFFVPDWICRVGMVI